MDYDSRAASRAPDAPGSVDPRPLRVAPDGRLLIPADMPTHEGCQAV